MQPVLINTIGKKSQRPKLGEESKSKGSALQVSCSQSNVAVEVKKKSSIIKIPKQLVQKASVNQGLIKKMMAEKEQTDGRDSSANRTKSVIADSGTSHSSRPRTAKKHEIT